MQTVANVTRPAAIKRVGRPKSHKKPPGLSRNVRAAVDDMVFRGMARAEAAKTNGLADHTLYLALRNPQVLAYWNECLDVLRASMRPRALTRIGGLIDAESEKVSLDAAKYIDSGGKGEGGITVNVQTNVQAPGYVVRTADFGQDEIAEVQAGAMIGKRRTR